MKRRELKKSKKPEWVITKEKESKKESTTKIWLYGIHAVRDALKNKSRTKCKLMITPNAYKKMEDVILESSITAEVIDPRKFFPPLEKSTVHQGVALEVNPLNWGSLFEVCTPPPKNLVLLLDRITDPQNVGAILRSAEVFGTTAVITPTRYSAPETGALAKTASGALERQPYLRVPNLARAIAGLKQMGYLCVGLDGSSSIDIVKGFREIPKVPIALVVGAEGPGLRELTLKSCDKVFKIPSFGNFGSLNVSNAAALALYITRNHLDDEY